MEQSKALLATVLAILLLGVVAGAGIGTAGETGSAVQANETTATDGPDLTLEYPDRELRPGERTTIELVIRNEAERNETYPPEIAREVATAGSLTAEFDPLAAPLEVENDTRELGDLGPGEEVVAEFTVRVIPNARESSYLLATELSYDRATVDDDEDGNRIGTTPDYERQTVDGTVVIASEDKGLLWYLSRLFLALIATAIVGMWLAGKVSARVRAGLDRVARVLFGKYISESTKRSQRLEAAYVETTYRTYAAKTLLFVVLGLVAGTISGGFFVAGVLSSFQSIVRALAGLPRTITRPLGIRPDYIFQISTGTYWAVVVGGALLLGLLTAVLAYVFRWQFPSSTGSVRRRGIEEGLPRTTAFMYALSRGGMEFPQILRTLARNRVVYGETAREMNVAVREMDIFGRDMITALRRMGKRTPSEQFKTFSENLTSILQSGSDLSTFFNEQYERFRDEAEERQEEVLELLATIAEGYVTVLVAGMLFLVTILLVFGLLIADTLQLLMLLIYLVIPLGNAGFAVFLQQKLDELGIARESGADALGHVDASTPTKARPPTAPHQPDGGLADERERANRQMLDRYDTVRRIKRWFRNPLGTFLWNPSKVLWVVGPIALLAVAIRLPAAFQAEGVAARVLDDILIQAGLVVLITYALFREYYTRRVTRIENAIPEMLERLASLNEAGLSVVDGVERVKESDLGVLTPEVQRIWRDVKFGSNVNDAFVRFGRRVRTRSVTRVVTLLTNAMRASGNMGPVLRIAAEQARAEVKLRRQRRQQMLSYLVVIYVSFFVFLVIVVAVNEVLVPSLPEAVPAPEGEAAQRLPGGAGAFEQFGDVSKAAYTLVFFHAAIIQGICAGFLAGQLGEGSLRDGAKHAAIMVTLAYVAFLLLSSPVASLGVTEATTDGESIQGIEQVSMSGGGYLAVYDEEGMNGQLLGHTEYLPAGTHSDVVIPLQYGEINETEKVHIVAHRDTDGNEQFDFRPPYEGGDRVDRPYPGFGQGEQPSVVLEVTYLGEEEAESDEAAPAVHVEGAEQDARPAIVEAGRPVP